MNNITSTIIISWESNNWRHRNKAVIVCKNYGLKPIMRNLYIGPLYQKEKRTVQTLLSGLFIKKTEKVFISSLCQSCFINLDILSKEKAAAMPPFEIIQLSGKIGKKPKKDI
ncbi:MAG: hypothetical protein V4665_01145 [Patescibacteria group bacterium]